MLFREEVAYSNAVMMAQVMSNQEHNMRASNVCDDEPCYHSHMGVMP